MKSEAEREYERKEKQAREFYELYKQMTPWDQFELLLRIRWMIFRSQIRALPLNWVKFMLDMERQFELHGMPFVVKLQLEKWFNYPPYPDVKEYFLWKDEKVWHYSFLEDDNFELHLRYKGRMPGNVWLQPEKDGTATIIGINIQESFRNTGLGTMMFQEAIRQVKGRVTCIRGVLEREDYPEPESSFRWLRRQGFEIKEKENGDYEVELWLE